MFSALPDILSAGSLLFNGRACVSPTFFRTRVRGIGNDLTVGHTVKGVGLFRPIPKAIKEQRKKLRKEETMTVGLLHRAVPARYKDEGILCVNLCEKNLPNVAKTC